MSLDVLIVFFLLILIRSSKTIKCHSCFNYNGQACVANLDCYGDFCLYEQIIRPNGVVSIKKACTNSGQYQFDDGTTITNLNQCVSRTSPVGQYYVMRCSFSDDCNSNCMTVTTTTPQPLPSNVLCHNCVSYDGSDCQSNVCQGKFCIYERRITSNQLMMRRSCTDTPKLVLDDGTSVRAVGICEIRNTITSRYFVKICGNANYCNNYCNPAETTTPQRQPSVICYECVSYDSDCFSGRCTAQFCLYERQFRQPLGTTYVKKTCTNSPFKEYPDGSVSNALNTCEKRMIQGVQYQVLVCNMGNNCNAACPVENETLVTCYNCEAANQDDCTAGTCRGSYCIFTRARSLSGTDVRKSCTNISELLYVDGSRYTSFGLCEYRRINAVTYAYKLCNSSSFCNSACLHESPTSTVSPFSSPASSIISFNLLFAAYFQVLFLLLHM